MTRIYEAGTVLFAAPDVQEFRDEARQYCAAMVLTMADAAIKSKDNQVYVILKRAIKLQQQERK